MHRRASDYALQTSRNRLKRSDRMAMGLGLAMTSATGSALDDADSSGQDQHPSDPDSDRAARRQRRREKKRRSSGDEREDDHPSSHAKSYSEGQGQSGSRHPLRRSDSSPVGHITTARWGSSLWGLGSWLDTPSSSSNRSSRRKRSSTKGSKDWNYPPGDNLEDSMTKTKSPAPAPPADQEEEQHSSDDSDSSTGTGSSTSSQADSSYPSNNNTPASDLTGRLLFANRIFTPFHHPSLTASVPNLPSEIRVPPVGTTGLGGMEDVDTVDFEGGESESDDDQHLVADSNAVAPHPDHLPTPPVEQQMHRGREASRLPTPSSTSLDSPARPKRSATVTPLTTPKGSRYADQEQVDDYFGPGVVSKEHKRQRRQGPVQAVVSPPPVSEKQTEQDPQHAAPSAQDETEVAPDEKTGGVSQDTQPGNDDPPPYDDTTRPPSIEVVRDDATSSTVPRSPRKDSHVKPNIIRRVLSFLRRAILALLMAPVEAVTFVCHIGRGKKRRVVEVRIDSVPTLRKDGSAADTVTDETEDEDDVVTEEQAQQRAERRARRRSTEAVKPEIIKEKLEAPQTASDTQSSPAPEAPAKPVASRKQSRLLPNPHPVDPMLVHDKNAKKITGELPAELIRNRERAGALGLVDQKTAEALVGHNNGNNSKAAHGHSPHPTSPSSPAPPGPRSAVIHHTPKILVLDLDETLIHSTSRSPTWTALRAQHSRAEAAKHAVSTGGSLLGLEGLGGLLGLSSSSSSSSSSSQGRSVRPHMVEVVLGGRSVIYHVYKRPHVDYFLRKVSAWYHVVVFTASVQEYADPVIDWLDQGRGVIAGRLFRDACTYKNGSYLKNLSIVDVDLSRVCLVDNSPASYYLNPCEYNQTMTARGQPNATTLTAPPPLTHIHSKRNTHRGLDP